MRLSTVALLGLAVFGAYASSPSIGAVTTTKGPSTTERQEGVSPTSTCVANSARRQVAYYQASDARCHVTRPSGIDPSDYTHAMLAFAVIDPETFAVGLENPDDEGVYRQFLQLPDEVHKGIAISGHAWSTVSSTKKNRTAFVNSLKSFLTTWKFTGIEIMWGWLGTSDRLGNVADTWNEVNLIHELREALGKDFSISVVLPEQYEHINTMHLKEMQDAVDWFTFLAYDLDDRLHTVPEKIDTALGLLWSGNLDMSKINMAIANRGKGSHALELDLINKHCLGGTALWVTGCNDHNIPPQLPRGLDALEPSPVLLPRSPQGIPTDPIVITTSAYGTAIRPSITYINPPIVSSVVPSSHYIITSVQGSAKPSSVASNSQSTSSAASPPLVSVPAPAPPPSSAASSPWVSVPAPAPSSSTVSSPWVSSMPAPAPPPSSAASSPWVSSMPAPAPPSSAAWGSQSSSQPSSSQWVPAPSSSAISATPSSGASSGASSVATSSAAISSPGASSATTSFVATPSSGVSSAAATSSNAGSSTWSSNSSGSVPSSSFPATVPGSSAQPSGSSSTAGSSSSQADSSGLATTSTAVGSSVAQSSGGAVPSSVPGVSQTIPPASLSSNAPEVTPIIPIIPPGSSSSKIPGFTPSIIPPGSPSSNAPGSSSSNVPGFTPSIIPPGSSSSNTPGATPSIIPPGSLSSNAPGVTPPIGSSGGPSSGTPGGTPSNSSPNHASSSTPGVTPIPIIPPGSSSSNAPWATPPVVSPGKPSISTPGGTPVSPDHPSISTPGGTPPVVSPGKPSISTPGGTPPVAPPGSSSGSTPGTVPKPTGTSSSVPPVPTTTGCPKECGTLDWCKVYCQNWVFPRPIDEQPPAECLLPVNLPWCHIWWFGPDDVDGSDGDPDSHTDSDPSCKPNNCIADCVLWRIASFVLFKRPICPCIPKKCDKDGDSDSPSDSDKDDPKGPKPKPTSYPKPNKPKCKLLGCGCGWMGLNFGPGCPGQEIDLNIPCGIFGCAPCTFFGNCPGADKPVSGILGYGGYCRGPGCDPCPPELCSRPGCTIAGGCGPKPGPAPTRPSNEPDPDNCEDNQRTVITEGFVICTEGFDVSAIPSTLWKTGSTSSTLVTSLCLPLIDATQTLCRPALGFDTTTTRTGTNTLTSDAPACTRAPLSLDDDEGNNNPDDSLFDTSSIIASNTTISASSTSSSASKTSTSPGPSHTPMDRHGDWKVDIGLWMWDHYSEVTWTLYDPNGFEAGKHATRGNDLVEMKDYIQSINRPFRDSMPFGVDVTVFQPHDHDHSRIKFQFRNRVSGCSVNGKGCFPNLTTEDYTESQPLVMETCEKACSDNGETSPLNKQNYWCDDLNTADWEPLKNDWNPKWNGWKRQFKCGWRGFE